jgi:stress-induced-phosphoprotein 1
MEIPEGTSTPQPPAPERKEEEKVEEEKVVEPEPMEVTEEKEAKERKAQAVKEKELGNAAYKKKEFEKAIEHYTKAMELDDEDISYLTNRAAVYLEMGKVN